MLALQRTTASTWGATMPKARQIYQAVVRSAMSYGAAVWHKPQSNASKPKGLAAKLQNQQNQGLRTVLGAFKATPTRQLHTESYVPPVDLWLNGRVARFQARMEHSGIAQKIRNVCSSIRTRILNLMRRQRRRTASYPQANTPGATRKLWVEEWTGQPLEQWDWQEKKLVLRDWEKRWHAENRKLGRIVRPGTDPGNLRVVPEDTPPTKQVLQLHEGLRKAESALLTQARTGKIGLAKFLYGRRVPGFSTATCQCQVGQETPRHMALYCTYEADRRHYLHADKRRTYTQMIGTNKGAKHFVRWMMFSGRLGQFALAKRLLFDSE